MIVGKSVITGTGCYIPAEIKKNSDFAATDFYGENGEKINTHQSVIAEKF